MQGTWAGLSFSRCFWFILIRKLHFDWEAWQPCAQHTSFYNELWLLMETFLALASWLLPLLIVTLWLERGFASLFLSTQCGSRARRNTEQHHTPSKATTHRATSRADDHNIGPPELFAKTLNNWSQPIWQRPIYIYIWRWVINYNFP